MKAQDRIQPVRFLICDDPDCARWPIHAYFLVGTKHEASTVCLCFSQEVATHMVQEMSAQEMLLPQDVPAINKAISQSDLPLLTNQADRIISFYSEAAARRYFIELVYDLTPPEKGSGETRFARCAETCGFSCCRFMTPHGRFYLRGRAEPIPGVYFSQETAERALNQALESGLVNEEQQKVLVKQISRVDLGVKLQREDRLARTFSEDKEWLIETVLGLRAPQIGAGQARFELFEPSAGQGPHGSIYLRGLAIPVTFACFSEQAALFLLEQLNSTGLASGQEVERISGQIKLAGLPESHELDVLSTQGMKFCEEKSDEDASSSDQRMN